MRREAPPGPWRYSDDTLMACSVAEVLRKKGCIDVEQLGDSFRDRYEPGRGYGPKMREILEAARAGHSPVAEAASGCSEDEARSATVR